MISSRLFDVAGEMRHETKKDNLFNRRAFLLGGAKLLLASALIGRLGYLQLFKGDEYRTMSDDNRIKISFIPPNRGKIIDRNGVVLADSRSYFRSLFDKSKAINPEGELSLYADLMEIDQDKLNNLFKKIKQPGAEPVILQEYLGWSQIDRIEMNSFEFESISVEQNDFRYYPYREIAAHVTGYIGPVNKLELEKNQSDRIFYSIPGIKIGKNGIEKGFEQMLRGEPGIRKLEVDVHGKLVREISREPTISGENLKLTIDIKMQKIIYDKLRNTGSSAVLMDVENGDILAMASLPSYDPNQFVQGIKQNEWDKLITDAYKPLINRPISRSYPPGSTFKIATALALLKNGIDPKQQIFCPGYYELGDRKFSCWFHDGHGNVDFKHAMAGSCNVYYFTQGRKIGIEKIAEMARLLGLGSKYNLGLPGEESGIVADKIWKKKQYKKEWNVGDTLNAAIGQGFNLATPLQLAVMIARLASGKMLNPNITASEVEFHALSDYGISNEHLELVREAIYSVVNEPYGTAHASKLPLANIQMAGKTGTAQVISKKLLEKRENLLGIKNDFFTQNHAWFVAYAPYDKPRYALSLLIEHGGGAASVAAPIARDILTELLAS